MHASKHTKNHIILHSLTHALKRSFYKDVFAQLSHLPLEYRIQSAVFHSLSMEFQISAKRQLLGHYLLSGIFLLWTVLDGSDTDDADQLVGLSFAVRLSSVELTVCSPEEQCQSLQPGTEHTTQRILEKSHAMFPRLLLSSAERRRKKHKEEKKESERVINEKQTQAIFGVTVPYWEGDVTNQSKFFFLLTLLHLNLYPWLITNTIYERSSKSLNKKGVEHRRRRRRKNHFLYWTCLGNCDKQSSGWEHLFLILKKLTQHKKIIFLHLLYGQITHKDM